VQYSLISPYIILWILKGGFAGFWGLGRVGKLGCYIGDGMNIDRANESHSTGRVFSFSQRNQHNVNIKCALLPFCLLPINQSLYCCLAGYTVCRV